MRPTASGANDNAFLSPLVLTSLAVFLDQQHLPPRRRRELTALSLVGLEGLSRGWPPAQAMSGVWNANNRIGVDAGVLYRLRRWLSCTHLGRSYEPSTFNGVRE